MISTTQPFVQQSELEQFGVNETVQFSKLQRGIRTGAISTEKCNIIDK